MVDDFRKYIQDSIDKGYINEVGKPLKCENCESTKFIEFDTFAGPVGVEEYKLKCSGCGKVVGHWAYGNWQV